MAKVVYHVAPHDGGWAYKVDGSISETFATHEDARAAAGRAALEQRRPGDTVAISWEDGHGRWHEETAPGGDRPATEVEG
jgi:hypothetical protein